MADTQELWEWYGSCLVGEDKFSRVKEMLYGCAVSFGTYRTQFLEGRLITAQVSMRSGARRARRMLSRLMRQMPEVDEDETLARPAQVAMEGLASVEEAVLADRMDLGRFFESKVQPVYAALDDCIRLGEIGAMYSAKVEA